MLSFQPFVETPVVFGSIVGGLVRVEAFDEFEQSYPRRIARGFMNIFPLFPYYALIGSKSNTAIRLRKHQRVSLANPPPHEIMLIKDDECSQYLPARAPIESVNSVHRASVKPQATKAISRLLTNSTNRIALDDYISVLVLTR